VHKELHAVISGDRQSRIYFDFSLASFGAIAVTPTDPTDHALAAIASISAAITSAPMTGEAAIQFIDEREQAARQRFEQLKNEMAGRKSADRDQPNEPS